MISTSTRRDFLATTAAAFTACPLRPYTALASTPNKALGVLKTAPTSRHLTPDAMLPQRMDGDALRALAARAVDAAKGAGASFADVRISESQRFLVSINTGGEQPYVQIEVFFSYGVRAVVNGAMAFIYGMTPTPDAIVTSARNAVASARGFSGYIKRPVELIPMAATTGEWSTPVQIDPFQMAVQEQAALLGAFNTAAYRVKYAAIQFGTYMWWTRDTRVFASTEGSVQTQHLLTLMRQPQVVATVGTTQMVLPVLAMPDCSGGYEMVLQPGLQEAIIAKAEDTVRLATMPATTFDVGRYDVVFDGSALAYVAVNTLGPSLELDRALGEEAGAGGTTFAMPPLEMLGTPLFSPHLSLSCDRAAPELSHAKWDDDGVECRSFPVIERGQLVDYYTTRSTVNALRPWYERRGLPVSPNGSAHAPRGMNPPLAFPGHMTVAPSPSPASLDDLCQGISKGILLYDIGLPRSTLANMDQQLASVQLGGLPMLEIQRGKVVRRIEQAALQFKTVPFWNNSLNALGDASTVRPSMQYLSKGQPMQSIDVCASAPAAHFTGVNVVSTGAKT